MAGEYRQYLATKETKVRAATNRIVDVYGSKSPARNAQYTLDKSAEVDKTYKALLKNGMRQEGLMRNQKFLMQKK